MPVAASKLCAGLPSPQMLDGLLSMPLSMVRPEESPNPCWGCTRKPGDTSVGFCLRIRIAGKPYTLCHDCAFLELAAKNRQVCMCGACGKWRMLLFPHWDYVWAAFTRTVGSKLRARREVHFPPTASLLIHGNEVSQIDDQLYELRPVMEILVAVLPTQTTAQPATQVEEVEEQVVLSTPASAPPQPQAASSSSTPTADAEAQPPQKLARTQTTVTATPPPSSQPQSQALLPGHAPEPAQPPPPPQPQPQAPLVGSVHPYHAMTVEEVRFAQEKVVLAAGRPPCIQLRMQSALSVPDYWRISRWIQARMKVVPGYTPNVVKIGPTSYGLAHDVVGLAMMMTRGAVQAATPSAAKIWSQDVAEAYHKVLEDNRFPDTILLAPDGAKHKPKACLRYSGMMSVVGGDVIFAREALLALGLTTQAEMDVARPQAPQAQPKAALAGHPLTELLKAQPPRGTDYLEPLAVSGWRCRSRCPLKNSHSWFAIRPPSAWRWAWRSGM